MTQEPPTVRIPVREYQPSKKELESDMRVNASFKEALKALCQPVKVKRVEKPE
ncbi:MAG: hypothetical protein OXC62_06410 [Aestuariivita sp.]|nr:hypothetical protein [Aestuariivita sp.]